MPQRALYRVSWWHQVSGSGLICFHLPAFEASIRRQFRFSIQFQRDCPKSLVVGQARTLQVQKRDENNLILVLCASQLCDQDATQHLFGQSLYAFRCIKAWEWEPPHPAALEICYMSSTLSRC